MPIRMKLSQLPPAVREHMAKERPRKPRKPRQPKRVPKPVTEARSWKFTIPGYLPPSLNELLGVHWSKRSKMKEHAANLVKVYGWRKCDVACAFRKRTVLITLTRAGRRKELDADNAKKILLDALVKAGLLGDDSPAWCNCPDPVQVKGLVCSTMVELRELP